MVTVYITVPPSAAVEIASALVDERLAACVNRFDCTSTYRWEGEVIDDDEAVLLAKTTENRYEDLKHRVEEIHPYEVPCIERFDEDDVLDVFDDWVSESVT